MNNKTIRHLLCNDAPEIKMAFYMIKARASRELLESLHAEFNKRHIS